MTVREPASLGPEISSAAVPAAAGTAGLAGTQEPLADAPLVNAEAPVARAEAPFAQAEARVARAEAPIAAVPKHPLVELRGTTIQYGPVTVLSDVDLAVHGGECVALVGANGSGKTTLLHALHGLVECTGSRRVALQGRRQAMVFQRPFMLRLSVSNNLRVALWLAGVPASERKQRVAAALQRAGLDDRRNQAARTLSVGQQQRLALARAWAVQPDLLFLDEPTASLDPTAKSEIERMLAGFIADGMTIVMSTHNLGQAKRLASRVVFIDHGKVLVDLPTPRFFAEHLDPRAGRFLRGEPTIGLVNGDIE